MKLLLSFESSDPDDDCEYAAGAYVIVDKDLAKKLLEMNGALDAIRETIDDAVYEIRLWSGTEIVWVDMDTVGDLPDEFQNGTTKILDVIEEDPGYDADIDTEMDMLHIHADGVSWSAKPEHRDATMTTVRVPWAKIEEAL